MTWRELIFSIECKPTVNYLGTVIEGCAVNCFLIILSSLYFIYSAEVLFLYFYGTFSRSPKVFNLEILPETLI